MILDTLSSFQLYLPVHRLFPVVSEFIHGRDLFALETGKYPLGRDITVIIDEYATRPPEGRFLECHRRFIDVQIMLSGKEAIGIGPTSRCLTVAPYNPEKDYEHLSGPTDFVTLQENDFAIFFPHDAHMPGTTVAGNPAAAVRKMVVKVPCSA